jgi:PAS domain S-box-containing protein
VESIPIIFCNDGFCELTGYSRAEVMQKSSICDFLHGPLSSSFGIMQLKQSLHGTEEKQVEILYYKKDGEYQPLFSITTQQTLRNTVQ